MANRDKGFDFATALRAFMRQDPDVLLVGETRDRNRRTAALTGHLVLSTLHANDAPSTALSPSWCRHPDRDHFPACTQGLPAASA